jgi:gamma-glutamyltranspeptidase / glutathione hydrolase
VAESGVAANLFLTKPLASQMKFVTRLPEGKRIFGKPDGGVYKDGDLFRQPLLAPTLRAVASQGADYMYHGDWAGQLVEAVQSDGGKLTLEDLADYKVNWADPLEVTYGKYQIASLAAPNLGGAITLIAMNLLAAAGLTKLGHYANIPEAMYWSIQISRLAAILANRSPDSLKGYFPDVDLSPASLLKPQTANKIWQRMQQPDWNQTIDRLRSGKPAKNHSAAVLAIDAEGNMASIVHSINSIGWGCSGIFVGGVSIPDSACIQQGTVAKVGPGKPLPGPANPVIVLKDGQPVLGSAAIGSALHAVTIQNLSNVLDFAMEPKKSADTPNFMGPYFGIQLDGPATPEMQKEAIGEGDFPQKLLDRVESIGQKVKALPKALNRPQLGYWIGIRIDREAKTFSGGVTPELNAHVEGY